MRDIFIAIGLFIIITSILIIRRLKDKVKKITFYPSTRISWSKDESELADLINEYRVNHGLNPLIKEDVHYQVAAIRGNDIIYEYNNTGKISHNLTRLGEFLVPYGITSNENLARGYTSIESCLNAWLRSETHVNTILKPDWEYTGLCIITGLEGKLYYCQTFGKNS